MVGRCVICGEQFASNFQRQVLCANPECKAENKRRLNRKYWKIKQHEQLESQIDLGPSVTRECLRCKKPFESHGFRICPKCHVINDHVYSESSLGGIYM